MSPRRFVSPLLSLPAGAAWFALALLAVPPGAGAGTPPLRPGLYVERGVLMREGRPYRGVGANYFSLFGRVLRRPDDRSGAEGLARLAQAGIPFVRFAACGFWPSDNDLYFSDKDAYFRRLDGVVRAAETNGIGLVPSLFWNLATWPDLAGEPMDQLGNPQSRTCGLLRQYAGEVVARYRDSPAIWAWEMGNEYNLAVDLPNAAQLRPPVWPNLKTARQRSARDELRAEHVRTALGEFARTVRGLDPSRALITGNAVPRACAWHNSAERSWQADTPEQFAEILRRDNPDPFDTICVHVYPEAKGVYPGGARSPAALVAALAAESRKAEKPLFVGEFGVSEKEPAAAVRGQFEELLGAIETEGVPLAAVWVFDLPAQGDTCNITFENDRAWMLGAIAAANRRMQGTGQRISKRSRP